MSTTTVGVFPKPSETHAHMWDGGATRMRVVHIGEATLHVQTRGVLDALQAALDEIRADMDAEAIAEPEAAS
jgi:hypothetical protein